MSPGNNGRHETQTIEVSMRMGFIEGMGFPWNSRRNGSEEEDISMGI